MITLYGIDPSPPSNKVRFVANALGVEYEFKRVNLAGGEGQNPDHLKLHPAGKVPVLQDGDFVLFESNAIIRYLADKAGSNLYPKDLKRRAIVDQWLDFSSMHIGISVGKVFFNRIVYKLMNTEQDERSLKDGISFLQRFLPVIDAQLAKSPFIAGAEMSLADICLLSNLDPAEPSEIDLSPYPNLVKWRNGLRAQDFYQKCFKSYGEMLQEMFAKRGS